MDSHTKHHPLTLELGFPSSLNPNHKTVVVRPPSPTLTLGLYNPAGEDRSGSAGSSLSNTAVKRERESVNSEDVVTERGFINSRGSDEDEEGTFTRKKLRLTKHQSALLEHTFQLHTTLNTKQKQDLADRLNLRSRQIEVWFQNRRARTKLKQTEVDCEYLKKCCKTLTDENKRLLKELEALKSMKVAAHPNLYIQLPAATLTMCPSCERVTAGNSPVPSKTPFAKPSYLLFPSFSNPYAAC